MNRVILMGIFVLIGVVGLNACKRSDAVSGGEAKSLVADYLEHYPVYKVGKVNLNRIKLSSKDDKELMQTLNSLIDEGYVTINDEKRRKKWFSKDSVWIVEPALTEKALPYVVEQNKNNVKVKTMEFVLAKDQGVLVKPTGKNSAVATVKLKKKKTPFYYFGHDNMPTVEYATQEFKLKYSEEDGWQVKH